MNSSLFREEAWLARSDKRFGSRILYQPFSLAFFAYSFLVLMAAFLAFAVLAPLQRTELVRGHLRAAGGEVKVYSPVAGAMTRLLVHEGDVVAPGQILAIVNQDKFDAAGKASLASSLSHLDSQLSSVETQIHVLHEQGQESMSALQQQKKLVRRELDLLQSQQQILERRLSLSAAELQRVAQLRDRRMVSESAYGSVLDEWYLAQQLGGNNRLQIESRNLALADLERRIREEPLLKLQQHLELQRVQAQLQARRKELELQGLISIPATAAGTVANLVAGEGDTLSPSVPLLTLLDEGEALEAILHVPSRALGKIALEQSVLLAYDSFPVRVYGYFPARIKAIANAPADPREHLLPLGIQEPVFLVRAAPEADSCGGPDVPALLPGMDFSAYVVIGSETLFERITAPLRGLSGRL